MKVWKIESEEAYFEQVLKITEEKLKKELSQTNKDLYYEKVIVIPKKKGHRRIIAVNKNIDLYRIQKNICSNFLNNIKLSDVAHGFKKSENYVLYLLPHISFYKNNYYLRLDIKNFFDSIAYDWIQEVIEYYFEENENLTQDNRDKLISYTMQILTNHNKVIPGSVSAPTISNIIFRELDIRLERYCKRFKVKYTRYADDLLFSSESSRLHKDIFLSGITRILSDRKLYINYDKIVRAKDEISLGGYVVSDDIRLSRKKFSAINRVLFFVENNKFENTAEYYKRLNDLLKEQDKKNSLKIYGKYSLINFLAGNRAFIIGVLRYMEDEKYRDKHTKILKRIEVAISKVDT